jgi:hypothetical protein
MLNVECFRFPIDRALLNGMMAGAVVKKEQSDNRPPLLPPRIQN